MGWEAKQMKEVPLLAPTHAGLMLLPFPAAQWSFPEAQRFLNPQVDLGTLRAESQQCCWQA